MAQMELMQYSFRKIMRIVLPTLVILLLYKIYYLNDLQNHYQVDFSSYYSAGLLLNNNENPYLENVIYDDKLFMHSQYLQPPIVAQFFRIFTVLPYEKSKSIWVLLNIIILLLMIEVIIKSNIKYILYFLLIIFLDKIFFPFYTLFERGQTDLLILLLIYCSYKIWKRGNSLFGGVFLALASILKLPVIFMFSVPLAIKDKTFIFAGISTHIIILTMSLVLNGVELNKKYFFNYLPHVGKTGNLPTELLMNSQNNGHKDYSINDKNYEIQPIGDHVSGGSITKYLDNKILGLLGFMFAFILVSYLLKTENRDDKIDLAWIISMLTILLFHPMTHVMNYVWMLLIIPMLINLKRKNNIEFSQLTNQFFNWSFFTSILLIGIGEEFSNYIKINIVDFYNSFYLNMGHIKVLNIINKIFYERIWIGCILIYFAVSLIILKQYTSNKYNINFE